MNNTIRFSTNQSIKDARHQLREFIKLPWAVAKSQEQIVSGNFQKTK
jgi:hypothetical protein